MNKRLGISIWGIAAIIITVIAAIQTTLEKPLSDILGIQSSETYVCYVYVDGISGVSRTLESDIFLEILGETNGKFNRVDPRYTTPTCTARYNVTICTENNKTITTMISEDGYLFFRGYAYEIESSKLERLIAFLKDQA